MSDETTPTPPTPVTLVPDPPVDLFHRFTKWLSYNRFTAVGLIAAVACVALASCQFKAKDPVSGQAMTSAELADAQAKAHAKAVREQAAAQSDYEATVAKVRAVSEAALKEAADKFSIGTAQRTGDIADADRAYATAQAEIERKNALASGALNLVQNALAAAPPSALGGIAIGGLALAGGLFLDNKRKNGVITALKAG